MLNVYGPTETTVNATVAECIPNRPVTIGRPLKHYSAYILDEKKEPVAPGETGELYIAGDGVARGYFRQPELSKEKFIADILLEGQRIPRLYRTGDLVRLTPDGELDFCGRMDTQVKIRGYRVELSEIESVLRELDCIQHAVVRVYNKRNLEELAAYVTTKRSLGSKDYRSILEHLQKRLPAFMVPSYLETLDFLPTLTSGKVDRKKLPDPRTPLILTERFIEEPKNETEWKLLKVWEKVFDIRPISTTDDFFLDLAGYSLIAAEAVSLLRHDYGFHVSLRDVYENPTIQGLAQYLNRLSGAPDFLATHDHASPGKSPSQEAYESVKPWIRRACTTVQALIIIAGYALASLAVGAIIFTIMLTIKGAFSAMLLAWILAFTLFFGYPTWVLTTVLGKWLVIGRIKPGRYPLWGFYYLRWWITVRLQAMSGMGFFISTPLLPFYMRLMGAKIGSNCVFDTALFATYDLLSIGDETSIGSQSQLLGYRIEDGVLVLGRIKIGKRCYVGTHSTLGIDVSMGDDCRLGDLSFLEDAMQMLPQTSWRGSPARPGKVPVPDIPKEVGTYRPCLWSLIHYVSLWSLMLSLLTTTIPPVALIVFAYFQGNLAGAFLALVPAAPLLTVCYCLFAVLAKLILLPKARPGVYPVMSLMALRKWLLDTLMVISRGAVHTLYTTLYLPIWLRMLGAKIGSRAEISTVSQLSPELVTIGDESFFADGSIIGYRKVFRGHVEYARSSIGRRSFVGNNAMLTVGYELEDNCLLGCLSVPPEDMPSVPAGSEWLGSPSFRLPHRKKIESFPIAETFHPNLYLYAVRCFIDGMRIMIPNLLGLGALLVFITCAVVGFHKLHFWWFLAIITPLGMALTFFLPLSVIGLKIMLMGQFKPVIKPLWSVYVWLNELINGAYETIGAPVLSPMLGTPFFAQYLRCLGCKIGKHTYIGTTLFSEFDLVEIGDYVALNAGVVIQNHLFEDRVMKSSYLKIGDGCSIGNMAVILYDTEIQERCSIAPLSLLMKGEVLTPHTRWVGIPTQQIQNNSRQGEKPFIPISLTSKRRATMN
jgi:non-ribosomal peptide synthetase-like protein